MFRTLRQAAFDLVTPTIVLFDWHATLVDTLDAMYHALDEALPSFEALGLSARMVKPEESRTTDDASLVAFVREHARLHPRIKAERKISRTDIFEVLFGADDEAKQIAHKAFNERYRNHFGEVHPFEGGERDILEELHTFDVKIGVLTNREREFFEHEISVVEDGSWVGLFDTAVCGGDTYWRKPNPEPILKALANLEESPGLHCWYVGDSSTDVAAAKRAGCTAVLFNGARWDKEWLEKVFPGTTEHPHQPDVIVDSFVDFKWLFEECLVVNGRYQRPC
ncbi:MAG: HAD family hydrolase [Pseudomonadota bacterium]